MSLVCFGGRASFFCLFLAEIVFEEEQDWRISVVYIVAL